MKPTDHENDHRNLLRRLHGSHRLSEAIAAPIFWSPLHSTRHRVPSRVNPPSLLEWLLSLCRCAAVSLFLLTFGAPYLTLPSELLTLTVELYTLPSVLLTLPSELLTLPSVIYTLPSELLTLPYLRSSLPYPNFGAPYLTLP